MARRSRRQSPEPPTEGLKAAFKIVTLQANSWEWARKTFGTAPAEDGNQEAQSRDG